MVQVQRALGQAGQTRYKAGMELYHVIADPACARVRRQIVAIGLAERVRFRNVDTGTEARADLIRLVGTVMVPTLVDEDLVISGESGILRHLEAVIRDPAFALYPHFDGIAREVWRELAAVVPSDLQAQFNAVHVQIADAPTAEQIIELPEELQKFPDEICGLHVGTPITEASVMVPEALPPQVYLFRRAILNLLDPDEPDAEGRLRQEIAITILHEIGHHFGLSEEDLDRLGYG